MRRKEEFEVGGGWVGLDDWRKGGSSVGGMGWRGVEIGGRKGARVGQEGGGVSGEGRGRGGRQVLAVCLSRAIFWAVPPFFEKPF